MKTSGEVLITNKKNTLIMTNQSILEKLKDMKLSGMHNSFHTALETRALQTLTTDEFIAMLVEGEYNYRRNVRVKMSIKRAKFRYNGMVEDVDFSVQRGLDKNAYIRLADCSFIERHENIIFTGPAGAGKSFLASALGNQACMMGLKVRYFNMSKLFASLKMSKADASYLKEMNRLEKQDLLILDDFGLQPVDATLRLALLDIIEDRHGKRSTIFVSQIPVNKWHELLGEQTVADAILDRVVYSSHRIELKGESMRKRNGLNVRQKS
jgi:DNA replication protein DnaC